MELPIVIELLQKIKSNKKYKFIADDIILEEIKKYIEKNKINSISKQDVSKIREYLHKSYASFQTNNKKYFEKYLKELDLDKIETIENLLSITLSTKERIPFYSEIYKNIFKITGRPKKIIDLGAGLNVLSYPLMGLETLTYYSYDINEEDIQLLREYFKKIKSEGLSGNADILDINNRSKIILIPEGDIIFLFKTLDIIDRENHKPSEDLIKNLISRTKFIVASFATKTITRKKMNFPKRKWFEIMLERNNLKFQSFETPNEIFYVVSK